MRLAIHWTTGNENMAVGNTDAIMHDSRTDVDSIVIVALGNAIHQVTNQGTDVMEELSHLMAHNVEIKACRNSMNANDISDDELIEGVEPVESGPGELAMLQDQGYDYLRP